jgi:diguanylate cyclase (GGDEF)-like protein
MPASPRQPPEAPRESLTTKILLFVFGSTLASTLIVSWVSIDSTRRALEATIAERHPLALHRASDAVSSWLVEARREAQRRVTSDPARAHSQMALRGWVRFGRDGAAEATGGEVPGGMDARRLARLTAERSPTLSAVPSDAGLLLLAWWPDADGGTLGHLSRRSIESQLAAQRPSRESVMTLVAPSGVLAGWSREGRPPAHLADLARSLPPDGTLGDAQAEGRKVLAAGIDVEAAPGWRLVVHTPTEAAYAPVLAVVTRVLAIDVGVILLFSLIAYRMTAHTLRPVVRLSQAAGRIAAGETDVELPEPTTRDELGLLGRAILDMTRRLRRSQQEIERANRDLTDRNERLQRANEVLNQLSITDGLTKLHNHRFFQDHLTRDIKRVTRTGEPLTMLLIDIDDFKQLNDRFGHAAGDELLVRIASILDEKVRDSDLLARYGGEEFVILAANTPLEGAAALAEKIRTAIAETSFVLDDSMRPLRVTVSVGVAPFEGNRKRFFVAADQALYRAKDAGKNCVVVAD